MPVKSWIALLALLLGLLVSLGPALATDPEVKLVDKDTVKAMLGKPDVLIIDVRQPGDWQGSSRKITGAQRYEPAELATWAPKLPKDKKIVLYCA